MTPEEVNKKYGYGQTNKQNNYSNKKPNIVDEILQNENNNNTSNSVGGFNMSVTKQKNIVGVFVFLILQIMFLFSHFTIAGAVNTLFVILYLVFKNIINNKTEETLTVRIGNYISLSFLNVLLITLFQYITMESVEKLADSDNFGIAIGAAIGIPILIGAYAIFGAMIPKKGPIISILKYLILGFVGFLFLNAFHEFEEVGNVLIFALIIFCLIIWLIDLFVNKITGKPDKTIIISAIFSVSVFVILSAFNQKVAANILYGLTHLNSLTEFKWYTVAIIAFVFVAAASVCFAIDYNFDFSNSPANETKKVSIIDDATTLILIGFDIICFTIGIRFYTKYIAIFAVALFVVNFISLIVPINKYKNDNVAERIFNNRFITLLLMMAVMILLFIGHINGIIDIIALIILSIIVFINLCDNKWKYNILILLVAIIGCDLVYHWHNTIENYVLIAIVTILFSVIALVIGIYNKKCEKDEYDITMAKCLVFILATIILLTPMSHTGAHIYDRIELPTEVVAGTAKEDTNKATITIHIRPHGKDNNIVSCSYYWTSNVEKVITPELKDNSFSISKNGADTLVVVCSDSNGVVTTYKHSYNIKV